MLRWLDGKFLHEVKHGPGLFYDVGAFLGQLNVLLHPLHNAVIMGRRLDWDLQRLPLLDGRLGMISDASLRERVHYYLLQYREEVVPRLSALPAGLIHNDANDWNVILLDDGTCFGIGHKTFST